MDGQWKRCTVSDCKSRCGLFDDSWCGGNRFSSISMDGRDPHLRVDLRNRCLSEHQTLPAGVVGDRTSQIWFSGEWTFDGHRSQLPHHHLFNRSSRRLRTNLILVLTSVSSSKAKKFILIPDLGTCCFGGQPRLTDMIEVTLSGDQTVRPSLRQVKIAGVLKVDTSLKPVKELQGVFYQLKADYFQ